MHSGHVMPLLARPSISALLGHGSRFMRDARLAVLIFLNAHFHADNLDSKPVA